MRSFVLSAANCPPPTAASGSTFPSDNAVLAYGACQGSSAFQNTSVYNDIESGIEAGVAAGALATATAAGLATGAIYALSIVGAETLAGAVWVAAAAAVPVLGWAVGIAVGIYEALNALNIGSCNMPVPSPNGAEQIDCSWYPQFVQNAMQWASANVSAALTMSVDEFSTTHNVFASTSDPLYKLDGVLPAAQQYIQGLPTAYDILRQIQLPAAAALIAAAPGLLLQVTGVLSTGQVPIQVQFPALTNNDVIALYNAFKDAYQQVRLNAQDFALNKANQPLNATSFAAEMGISSADAVTIITSNNIPYTGVLGSFGKVTPITGGDVYSGGGVYGSAPPSTLTRPSATGVLVGTAAIVGIGALLYHVFVGGYTFYSTGKALVHGTKTVYGKTKEWVEKRFHHGRRKNPIQLERKSATGGRDVAYRADLDSDRDRIALTKSGAIFFRNEKLIAKFKASRYQKTKIRSGTGEVLIFTDQLT